MGRHLIFFMDEFTFWQLLADKVTLKVSSSVVTRIGKFDAMVESGKIMALATFHVIKGRTLNRW